MIPLGLSNCCPWEIKTGREKSEKEEITAHSILQIEVIENISIDFVAHTFNKTVRFSSNYKEKRNSIVLRISDHLFILTVYDSPSQPL